MTKLLTTLLFLSAFVAKGQDTTKAKDYLLDGITISVGDYTAEWNQKPDTFKVIMLVCDTGKIMGTTVNGMYYGEMYSPTAYFIFGYITTHNGDLYFLDEKKNRIPRRVVVWDYRFTH